jgi:hypothetical protein
MAIIVADILARLSDRMPPEIVALSERTEPFCVFCDDVARRLFCDSPFDSHRDRRNEDHYGVCFGDGPRGEVFEGDAKLLNVFEVQAGDPGWVLESIESRRSCPHHPGDLLCRVRIGSFRVEDVR